MSALSSTRISLPDAEEAFLNVSAHIAEHGIVRETVSPAHLRFRHEGAVIQLQHDEDSLSIDLEAPSSNMLYFLKEAATLHVAEIDPLAAETLRWSDQSSAGQRPVNFSELRLLRRSFPLPGLTRLTLAFDQASDLLNDGLHMKLMLPSDRTREPVWPIVEANGVTRWPSGPDSLHVRYFTFRNVRPGSGEVDIDVVQHPGGMISDWALTANEGERIGVMGPGGGQPPADRQGLLIAGDQTALPAIARILESCGQESSGHVVIAFPEDVDTSHYLPPSNLQAVPIAPNRFRQDVASVVQEIGSAHRIGNAWFGGEYTNAQALRKIFKQEFGLSQGQQLSVAYWREGLRGDAKRESD